MPCNVLDCCIEPTAIVNGANSAEKENCVSIVLPTTNLKSLPNPSFLYEREFIPRESPLTEIFKTKHGSSVYRICMVLSILTFASSAIASLANDEELQVGQEIILYNVKGVPLTVVAASGIIALVYLLFSTFRLWALRRHMCKIPVLWDALFITPVFTLLVLLIVLPASAIWWLELPPVCRFGLLMEQIRYLLKIYSFFRVKIPEVFTGCMKIPSFREIVVYNAVPTMIYKDSYPRLDNIRWTRVMQHCFELFWAGVIGAYVINLVHTPITTSFRSVWLDARPALIDLINNLVPTTLILLIGFFGYFHSFCNLIAELTGFQDRLFYKDWWNADCFKTFFTTWNTLIQDWLYHCVYLDVRKITHSPEMAAVAVFLVSGVLHEYVLCFFFGFFYPVMAVIFVGVGSLLKAIPTSRISSSFGNLIMWLCIPFGSGIIFTAYMTEIAARVNCPYPEGTENWSDFFIPRSWSCPLRE